MSAPAQKTYGFPVSTIAAHSPASSSSRIWLPEMIALRPSTVGFVWSAPLSIVTSASGPACVVTRLR